MIRNLKGTEKQVKYAEDLLTHLDKYINRVLEGYDKGEALEEEKEEFNQFVNEKLSIVLKNEKGWEVINILQENNKKLWFLEDKSYLDNLMEDTDNDEIEYEYNLADNIVCELKRIF